MDFGIGAGLHNLKISSFVEGAVPVVDETTEFMREEAKLSQPLPNIVAWGRYSPAKRWLIHGRVDWISANIGAYDGTLWNINGGVNFELFRNMGIDLSYQYFGLDLTVDKSEWQGSADLTYKGPVVSIAATW